MATTKDSAACNGDGQSPWTRRPDTPVKVMFNTVTVDDAVYLFPDYMVKEVAYLHNYCNNEYVDIKNFSTECFKYDGIEGKFSVFAHYPATATSLYKTVSFDPVTRKCWIAGGTHDIFAQYALNKKVTGDMAAAGAVTDDEKSTPWDLDYNFSGVTNTTGPLPVSVHVQTASSCRFHMIGGHNSRYHEVWDDKQRRMRPVYEFATRLKGRELAYVSQWDTLFMFGGCLWEGTNFKDTVRFRYINDFYRCRNPNDVDHIRWEKMEGAQWALPYNMMGFGHLLLDDTKLVIFGGRVAGGQYMDEIWMFDMASPQWFQSTLRIPQRGKYRASLIVGAGQIELFQYGHPATMNQCHFSIKVADLMASMKSVDVMPAAVELDTEKVRKQNVAVFERQRQKYCGPQEQSMEEKIRAVQSNKELSNRQKSKMIRMIRRKTWKYSKDHGFGDAVAKRTHLLPAVGDHAESVGDEEVSLSLERSPVTPPMNGTASTLPESSDIDLKEDGEPEEMVRVLKAELARVRAENSGLVKKCQLLTSNVKKLKGVQDENKRLRALLAENGISAQ